VGIYFIVFHFKLHISTANAICTVIGLLNEEPVLLNDLFNQLRGGADKSLTRHTSRSRRTESIVSLERGVRLRAELQFFLLQKLKGSMSGDARDFNNIETRAVIFFFLSGLQTLEQRAKTCIELRGEYFE
jgi:hypothetical protein